MRGASTTVTEVQLDLGLRDLAGSGDGWGGERVGAGRKRIKGRHDADHVRRPWLPPGTPLHVVLRTLPDVPRLRQADMFEAIRGALRESFHHGGFRVCQTTIQHNHLHFIVEVDMRDHLIRGMQSLAIRLARAINRAAGRTGKVFAFRYHATRITTPRQMRNTLAYVLNNWRRHGEDRRGERARRALVDPYSTGVWFTGWKDRDYDLFRIPKGFEPLPAANPTCWLLTVGWRSHPLIDPREIPGPIPRSQRARRES